MTAPDTKADPSAAAPGPSAKVRYLVDDVQKAADFYTTHLGFTLDMNFPPAIAQVTRGPLSLLLSGPTTSGARATPDDLKDLRRRNEEKGWSNAKIDRAIADLQKQYKAEPPLREDVVALLSGILRDQGHVELILHWHSGAFAIEPFELAESIVVECGSPIDLERFREDVRFEWRWRDG